MAFDMYLANKKIFIDVHEEALFHKINEDERFPKLNWIWEHFYNGPEIIPEISNDIVHELILLKNICEEEKIIFVIEKLLPFFSNAYRLKMVIKTRSD